MNALGETTFAVNGTGSDAPSKETDTASSSNAKGLFWKVLTVIRLKCAARGPTRGPPPG
jgi:hypothetical protein